MKNHMLELRHVSKSFGGIKAVEDLSISVDQGDIHCLIGPNGAGKTTAFRMITGQYSLTSGKVLFEGKEISGKKAHHIVQSGISMKMQIPGVFEALTIRENLRIAAGNYVRSREMEERIDELIELVHIKDLGNRYVKNLSHGQQQWLEIAMALATNPRLLLLDEPAAGMGPEETAFTGELVKELNKSGLTILFIDHDMDFVKQIAQKVTVMHYGKLFAQGSVEEITHHDGVKQIYLGSV
ncbi:MAG: ABC transporter ATP-binding protein [Lachnospiraceae bacterium]|nr:ABC transporter ATP-binding protein [Lachnospiraceae bacterium]